jgi:predicted nucleotidyltransferase
MNTGLSPKTLQALESVFKQFDAIDKVVLYGSRALGTHRPGSDIDLALFGNNVTPDLIASIAILIDDLLLPYTLDLTAYALIDNDPLREHIDRVGIELFRLLTHSPL